MLKLSCFFKEAKQKKQKTKRLFINQPITSLGNLVVLNHLF